MPPRASCRWARRPTSGRTATSRPASRTRRSSSTKPSSTPNTSHQTLEPRTAMAYWQNGKLYMHCSTQSTIQTVASVARWLHIEPTDIVLISNYTGGGFGSKATRHDHVDHPGAAVEEGQRAGADAHQPRRRALHRRRASGRARPREGRLLEGRPHRSRSTCSSSARTVRTSSRATPVRPAGSPRSCTSREAMRWRGIGVLTNTPPRRAQSQPGGMQGITLIEPILAKAARKLGIDQVAIRRINAPEGKAKFGPAEPARTARLRDERVRQGGARQGRRDVQLGSAQGAERQAARARRSAASASR